MSASRFMRRALALALEAAGSTSPNPPVGAVAMKGGQIVGEGHTQPAGQAHAEVVALRRAGARARGASLFVTLEPCSHHGRTPPCTDAVIRAGVSEVVAAVVDPNPLVGGRGLEALRAAGISVAVGDGEDEAAEIIAPHAKFIRTGLPLVTAKFAMSLDGKIATRTGDSKWITSAESRRYVHELRRRSDAIMVGIGTALADDPQLTARDADDTPLPRQPLRVVVDSKGRLPSDAAMLRQPGDTLVVMASEVAVARTRLEGAGASVVAAGGNGGGRVELGAVMAELGRREVTSVFVEGGGELLGSLFDDGLVDRVIGFVAPVIIGGTDALSPVGGAGAARMGDAVRLSGARVMRFGGDVAVVGTRGILKQRGKDAKVAGCGD